MFNLSSNQILLLSCLLLLVGTGTYLTYFRQQNTLNSLEEDIEAKQEKKKKIRSLKANLSEAKTRLDTVRQQWQARYKIVPQTVTSPAAVGYLTELSKSGFKTFNLSSEGQERRDGYSVRSFSAQGQTSFQNLYQFVWTLENNRPFYRVRDLNLSYVEERKTDEETGRTTMDILVSFQMDIDAIYGVTEGLKERQPSDEREVEGLPVAQTSMRPPLPSSVLPNPAPGLNPFYPVVFEQIPPNEYGRVNVETASLVSIIDGQAVFRTRGGFERLAEGDKVYLGRIVEVDASDGRVVARLDKGGIIETVRLTLNPDSLSRPAPDPQQSGSGKQEE